MENKNDTKIVELKSEKILNKIILSYYYMYDTHKALNILSNHIDNDQYILCSRYYNNDVQMGISGKRRPCDIINKKLGLCSSKIYKVIPNKQFWKINCIDLNLCNNTTPKYEKENLILIYGQLRELKNLVKIAQLPNDLNIDYLAISIREIQRISSFYEDSFYYRRTRQNFEWTIDQIYDQWLSLWSMWHDGIK